MNLDTQIGWTRWQVHFEEPASGTLREFLTELFAFSHVQLLPPYPVMVAKIEYGQCGGGMSPGLYWAEHSITLDRSCYDAFASTLPEEKVARDCNATTLDEWSAWLFMRLHGIDYADHMARLDALRHAERVREELPSEAAEEAWFKTTMEYSMFLSSRLKPR